MVPLNHDQDFGERRQAQEGAFDAQMTFAAAFVEAPPLTAIVKRDGRLAPFDKHKIAEAIFRAAQSIGGTDHDRAERLASAVAIYLAKAQKGRPPSADQVNDAVEKVLVEMGHLRTASTYARYRDRKARARGLRRGSVHAFLREFSETADGTGEAYLVRTSAETLAEWDRARIAQALVRETDLDEARAAMIAAEVEQQIVLANVRTITTPLIRELVGAKLIEHGLEEHHRRHMRLGVPLYDAERIIRGPSVEGTALDPDATGRILAEAVKREFALAHVFSADVADAHWRGDLHLHDLGAVDRLHGTVQSLEYIMRFGVGLHDARTFSRPPKYADTLLAQMVSSSHTLRNHFSAAVGWDAVNVFFAPFLAGFDAPALRQVAQMLVYEYAYRAILQGGRGPVTEIGLCWDVPSHLREAEAVGPGGVPAERAYGDYRHTAQQFAWALLDVLREGGVGGTSFPAPTALVYVDPSCFASEGHEEFLAHAAQAALRGNVHFILDRNPCLPGISEPWESRDTIAQRVTVNLARATYRGRDEEALKTELGRMVELAAQAHAQKRDFIEQLLARRGFGPLGLLAVERNGRPYVDVRQASYLVGLTGLDECVQHRTGHGLHQSEKAVDLALRLVAFMVEQCRTWSERLDLSCVLAQTTDAAVSHRFALIDLQEFPGPAGAMVKQDPMTQDILYTPGMQLSAQENLSPIERARLEGQFHPYLAHDAITHVRMPDADTAPRSIVDFLRKVYHQTTCRRIVLCA